MKIAILSDTHNQQHRLQRALELARDYQAQRVLHCGDIEDPFMIELFANWQADFVLGNCDLAQEELRKAIEAIGGTLHRQYGHLEIAGKNIAFLHGHITQLQRDLEQSGAYDYLFHGHTHVEADSLVGTTRVINPGALYRAAVKTFVVLDVVSGERQRVVVE
jgi:putative phosphoesterase